MCLTNIYLYINFSYKVEIGSHESTALSCATWVMYAFFSGTNLRKLLNVIQEFESIIPNKIVASFYACFQAVINILGKNRNNKNPAVLDGDRFDYKFCFDSNQKGYSVSKASTICAIVAYLFGDYSSAYKFIERCRGCESTFRNMFVYPVFVFYDGLISLEMAKQQREHASSLPQNETFMNHAKECISKMKSLSENAPSNFLNKLYLLQAEMAAVLGDTLQANKCYQEAITLSEKNGFFNEEAIACERAGIFLLKQHEQSNSSFSADAATQLFITSYKCYEKWGAAEKMKHLKVQYLSNTKVDLSSNLLNNSSLEWQDESQDCVSVLTDENSSSIVLSHTTVLGGNKINKRRRLCS